MASTPATPTPGGTAAGSPTGTANPAAPAPGTAGTTATGTPTPPSAGQLLGTASNSAGWTSQVTAQAGGQLQLSVTVVGPLTVYGGCVATLTARAETEAGGLLPTPTPAPGAHCLAIALISIPAGTSRTFTAGLPEPQAPGTYVIQGSLDGGEGGPGVPAVTISI